MLRKNRVMCTSIMIPHSRSTIGEEEAEAAAAVIRSGLLVDGEQTKQFERLVAEQTGAAWGVAVGTGTAALHLALLGLGVGPGDRVAIPSFVCVALLHAIRYLNAEPVVIDIDPNTLNIDPDVLKRSAPARLKAVIVPHMFGLPAELNSILALGVPVIEDCALAIGAEYRGKQVGGQGHLGICSFYATKMITTGEGGMVVGHDFDVLQRLKDLRDYDQPEGDTVRFNYRLTEMQAAIGRIQLRRLPTFLERRRHIATRYHEVFERMHCRQPIEIPDAVHAYYRYVIQSSDQHPLNLDQCIAQLDQKGVACRRPVSKPIHQLLNLKTCPGADAVFKRALSIPIYLTLSDQELATVIDAVHEVTG